MGGETNLNKLLGSLSPVLAEGLYVFVTVERDQRPADLACRMVFEEAEGTTLIVLKSEAEKHALPYEFPCRMITLNVHSSLEAVGFMARIASVLATHEMGVNPVSGYFHDHIFVPDGREQDAMRALRHLAKENR